MVLDSSQAQILGGKLIKQLQKHITGVLECLCTRKFVSQAETFRDERIALVGNSDINRQRAYLRRAVRMVLERMAGRFLDPAPSMRVVLTNDLLARAERMAKIGSAVICSRVMEYLAHPWWKEQGSKQMQ